MEKERELEIIEMHEGGLPIQGIAEELGISTTTIRNVLKKHDLPTNKPVNDDDEIVQQYLEWVPVQQILTESNISYSQLYEILRKRGIPTRKAATAESRNTRYDKAVEMYQEGFKLWQIKSETGVHQPMLHDELHKRSIPLRRQFTRPVDSAIPGGNDGTE